MSNHGCQNQRAKRSTEETFWCQWCWKSHFRSLHRCKPVSLRVCIGFGNITLSPLSLTYILRSTPFEALHILLLGLYKYLLRLKINKLSNNQKEELRARISAFYFVVVMRTFQGTWQDSTSLLLGETLSCLLNLQFIYYRCIWMMECGLSYQRLVWVTLVIATCSCTTCVNRFLNCILSAMWPRDGWFVRVRLYILCYCYSSSLS